MRRFKKRNSFWEILLLIFVVIICIIIYLLLRSNLFTIQAAQVKSEKIDCTDENNLKEKSEVLGKNIFLLDEKNIEENIKKNFICIKSVNFSKVFPNRIKINVAGRNPVAQLISVKNFEVSVSALIENTATPSSNQKEDTYLSDNEGVVFSKADDLDIPKIYIFGHDLSLGNKLPDDYLQKSLNILNDLKNLGIDNKQTNIFNNLFITTSVPKIIFRLDQDIRLQIASLQLILKIAKIDKVDLEFIDLRFDKPIVKFAPKKNG